jgi:DNA transformation protein and related proteins
MGAGLDDHVRDLLAPLGGVSVTRMFGGLAIRRDGVMFALVSDGVLYFKTDEGNRPAMEAEGSSPFAYDTKTGRTTITSYWRAPERLYDEPEDFLAFARDAVAAARRVEAAKERGGRAGRARRRTTRGTG